LPVVAILLENNRQKICRQQCLEGLFGLFLQFEAVHQEQHTTGVLSTQEELDDGSGSQCFAGARCHLEQEPVISLLHGSLKSDNRLHLIGPQEAQLVGLDVAGALDLVLPSSLRLVLRTLGQHYVVVADTFLDEAFRVGSGLVIGSNRAWSGEGRNQVWIAALQVPEIVQVAIGEHHEATVLRPRILTRLLLANERILVLRLSLKNNERETFGVQQQEVDEAPGDLLEIVAQGNQVR